MENRIVELKEKIWQEFGDLTPLDYISEIIRFHRMQVSSGFKRAAEYVYETLSSFDISSDISEIETDENTMHWAIPGLKGWDPVRATLWIIEPFKEKLADFRDSVFSIINRSDSANGEFELILDRGDREFRTEELLGKIVLTSDPNRILHAGLLKNNTTGILYYHPELYEARRYRSFFWSKFYRVRTFGFVITAKKALELQSKLIGGVRLKLKAEVESRNFNGAFEVVEAVIEGSSNEEIVLVAHLCHPKGEANDNASGVSALMEAARTLKTLIKRGELKRPLRTIRFLFVPEIYGTIAYLERNPDLLERAIAGLNLDMVGQNQEISGGSWLIERVPESTPNFVNDLIVALRDYLLPDLPESQSLGESFHYLRYAEIPFSGGSDHIVFSDPSVNIPMPMLIQWPDKFYHSNLDTIDKIDPLSIKRNGVLAALFAYFIANLKKEDTPWLFELMYLNFSRDMQRIAEKALLEKWSFSKLERKLKLLKEIKVKDIDSLKRLDPELDTYMFAQRIENVTAKILKDLSKYLKKEEKKEENLLEDEIDLRVPKRIFKGPVILGPYLPKLSVSDRKEWLNFQKKPGSSYVLLALYFADGRLSVGEIYRKIRELRNLKIDPGYLRLYFKILANLGLIELR